MNVLRPTLFLAALSLASTASAQSRPRVDFSLDYAGLHASPLGAGGNFWLQGGAAELGADAWHGLGIAAKVTGTHTGSFGPNAIPLTLVTTTFGPRYRYTLPSKRHDLSVFGEGLIGEAHGVGSIFPSPTGLTSDALSFASEVGGGVDLALSRRFAIRAIQVSWIRTQLPNSSSNVQNNTEVDAGVVLRF